MYVYIYIYIHMYVCIYIALICFSTIDYAENPVPKPNAECKHQSQHCRWVDAALEITHGSNSSMPT